MDKYIFNLSILIQMILIKVIDLKNMNWKQNPSQKLIVSIKK